MNKMTVWWKRLIVVGLIVSIITAMFILVPNEKKTVLTFGMFAGSQWDVPNDDCYKIIDEAIEEFEKEHPNVEVQYVSGILKDDYSEWLAQNALKGNLPDVFMVLPQDFDTFSSVGVLKPLDTMVKEDSSFHKENYYRGCYAAGEFEDHQYALPYESVPTFMFVNKTLLKKEHIKMPDNSWTCSKNEKIPVLSVDSEFYDELGNDPYVVTYNQIYGFHDVLKRTLLYLPISIFIWLLSIILLSYILEK